jgi:hypothetical protein
MAIENPDAESGGVRSLINSEILVFCSKVNVSPCAGVD